MATAKTNRNAVAAAAARTIAKPATGEKPQGLKVVPKRAGFRRAGYAFADGETVIPLSDLSDEQYRQLTTEPMLVTYLVDLPLQPDATAAA